MPKNNVKNLILITIISLVLISSNIGGLYIYALDEAKNSVCAREMMERGDLIVPTFNHELRADKPPLHYYFMQIAYHIFGVNEFSARFFSVIMGILTVISTWWFASRYLGQRAALYSSLILISSLHFVLQFHMAVPDPYLIFLLTFGFSAFFVYYTEGRTIFLILAYVSFGLGTLTKGPIAIILPGLSILLFLAISRRLTWNYILRLKPLLIVAVFLIVILPWFVLVDIRTDGLWTREFFIYHNINRYTSTMEGHGSIFLMTPLMVFIGLLPFSVFIIQSLQVSWKERMEKPVLLYGVVIALVFIVFFSISKTKLPNYTVPAYPFIAIVIGNYLAKLQDTISRHNKSVYRSILIYVLLMILIPVGLYYGLKYDDYLSHLSQLALYFIILPTGGFFAIFFRFKNNFKGIILSIGVSWLFIILLFFYYIFPKVDQNNSVAKTIKFINKELPVASYKIYNSAFSFYIRKPFSELENINDLKGYIKHTGGYIITRKAFSDELKNIPQLKKLAEAKDIFEIPTTVIYEIDEGLPAR